MDLKFQMVEAITVLMKDCGCSWLDVRYVRRRFIAEGAAFITTKLPKFAKFVLSALQTGCLGKRKYLSDFAWKGGLPQFLEGYLKMVFDRKGRLLESPDPLGLWVIRQVCEYCYKLCLEFDSNVLEKAENTFVETDESLPSASSIDPNFLERLRKNVETQYTWPHSGAAVLKNYRPRFGPGTFADGNWLPNEEGYISSTQRNRDPLSRSPGFVRKVSSGFGTTVLSDCWGIAGFFKSYPSSPERLTRGPDTSPCSELLFVPKDSRGPRTIVREPARRLMLQMAYFDWMVDFCERNTHNRVNFRDQQINRDLAAQGSRDGKWSTIDLSEASDRVSLSVVLHVFQNIPAVRYFLLKRSKEVLLPSGKRHTLKKLAGMGSGLTFATMAFLIHSVIATALARFYGSYRKAAKVVYVYGDDIIVPTVYCQAAMKALESIGLLVNRGKSFTLQRKRVFRESCGGDYLDGQDVGPIRLKLTGGVTLRDGLLHLTGDASVLQLERHCRELVKAGFNRLAAFYYSKLETVLGPLPSISSDTDVLGRYMVFGQPEYQPSDTGKYRSIRAYKPCLLSEVPLQPNPYYFVGKRLSPHEDTWDVTLQAQAVRFDGFKVTKPRVIELRKRKVSTFALMASSTISPDRVQEIWDSLSPVSLALAKH